MSMLPYYTHSWMMYRHQQQQQQQQQQQWMMYHRQQQQEQHQQQQEPTTIQYQNAWYSSNYQQQQQEGSQLPLSTPSQPYYQQQHQCQSLAQFQQYNNYYGTNTTNSYQYGVYNYEQHVNNETTPIPSTLTTISGPLSENSTSTLESETTNKRPPFKWLESSEIEEKPGRTRTKEKYRMVYTEFQRIELEKEFHCQKRYITVQRKLELSEYLGLSERQIKIWFQNRRAKERRQQRQTTNDHRPNQESLSSTTSSSSSSSMNNQENCCNYLNYPYGNCLNNSTAATTTATNSADFATKQQSTIQGLQYLTSNPNTYCNLYQNNVETNKNHPNYNYNIDNVVKSEEEFDDNSTADFEFVDVQDTS